MSHHNHKSIPPQSSVLSKKQQFTMIEARQAPLPAPDDFAQYEQILPGSAERILRMAEIQASHRQNMERQMIIANIRSERRGQWFGLIVSIVALALAGFSAYYKQPLAVAILGNYILDIPCKIM